ncbi:hypothetical protein PGT21_011166 [Puccinia graminis f. sp. tritici]|uniref:Uncharacterized protein n=1 Tax=Puccinia graminis f. sp. tritici TaxID=56615 RepID=A0A5B0NUN5_PUCGR|nr:hypothetical protein PGT21_011166 [Puccinia graminis f. sp. tritici]KAA1093782.1 hypothetical protein PGTUg99_029280 [Puccinia graminis f. sp. tritici]
MEAYGRQLVSVTTTAKSYVLRNQGIQNNTPSTYPINSSSSPPLTNSSRDSGGLPVGSAGPADIDLDPKTRGSADTHTFHQTSNRSIILSNTNYTNRLTIHHQVRHRSGSINHQLPNRLLKQPKKPPRGTIFTGLNLLCHTCI